MNRNNLLMQLADKVLEENPRFLFNASGDIPASYNGQISALGVSVAMNGLCATLATYYKGSNNDTRAVDRRPILEVIARMIHADSVVNSAFPQITNAENLMRAAIRLDSSKQKILQKEIIECAVALKQVIRTYNLV